MKTLIIVPAYNEEESLPGVIRDLRENIRLADILVVNDGSKDATARIAQAVGVAVLNLPFNLGIGGAMQAGYLCGAELRYSGAIRW
jgi:glycosyltransferase involved in cell wall biosynthesis